MGVASIPCCKDQRACDEWNARVNTGGQMDVGKSVTEDFVTVVSVESQQPPENFVTVLSIGTGKENDGPIAASAMDSTKDRMSGVDGPLEEEVEVYRLPGERLGFGLKFEGGNKTTERVRRLFVQSCAEQSPASRAKCSWGTLGEGDEVLSIDGVPVTHMTRLDCVRRLQESQLVIKLTVRCRGALRPEVVSAEKKTSPERNKVPPELPSQPPPVPPRKLRQARGSADGEANPSPVKKSWNGGSSGSQNGSPGSQSLGKSDSKSSNGFESCESSPKSINGSLQGSPKEYSPEMTKSKQEPAEAMVYVDARSQCGSTHGSTSDDTGSSMSTVIDRFSTSDRVSTVSTVSTASTASEQPNEFSRVEQDFDRDPQLSKVFSPLDNLESDCPKSTPDYLLRRLAISEAVTHVESRGEIEKITAVVAPNTVLIEETIAFQPPLSFQDAPLSYGHETRPDLFYTADLAADSSTHFRPIKDDVELVERVNNVREEFQTSSTGKSFDGRSREFGGRGTDRTPPPLPARNHVNRISVNQTSDEARSLKFSDRSNKDSVQDVPGLPPKPMPRRDVKNRRKRPPPPPPPPPAIVPRTEAKTSSFSDSRQTNFDQKETELSHPVHESIVDKLEEIAGKENSTSIKDDLTIIGRDLEKRRNEETDDTESMENYDTREDDGFRTNKVLEIIEIRKAKALLSQSGTLRNEEESRNKTLGEDERVKGNPVTSNCKLFESITPDLSKLSSVSTDLDDSDDDNEQVTKFNEPLDEEEMGYVGDDSSTFGKNVSGRRNVEESMESYRARNDYSILNSVSNRGNEEEAMDEDTSDESDGDYYWQSNLATIGEEEETNSLEYSDANKDLSDNEEPAGVEEEESLESSCKEVVFDGNVRNDEVEDTKGAGNITEAIAENHQRDTVNGRMDNCGGGQRLPPDGDEFPAAYQEFNDAGNNQQYRFVTSSGTSTRTATMIGNGRLVCDENESYVSNDAYKLLETNAVNSLSDNRVTGLTNVDTLCQDTKKRGLTAAIETKNGKMNAEKTKKMPKNVSRETGTGDDFVKKTTSVTNYSSYGNNQGNGNSVLVSEKKIEITGYYHKDVPPPMMENPQDHVEKDVLDTPPPLPLTGPPKLDPISPTYSRNVPVAESSPRKFSLNGESWRQDDKSERSVRDKIAMFSSQSSLDGPLFPSTVTITSATSNVRRLSKYKSTEDVCSDERNSGQRERSSFFADRTQSSFDLTDSVRVSNDQENPVKKYGHRSSNLTQSSPLSSSTGVPNSKTFPIVPQKPINSGTSFETSKSPVKNCSLANSGQATPTLSLKPVTTPVLSRATSFSGSTPYGQERTTVNDLSVGSQVTRTNSLASTFKRPAEDVRRTSLNQLIEQRRRSISKLRGLVIPEKETIPIDTPIVDLPEIKSRDSILLHQLPKATIQDKWGSQSSLASNASTASVPMKATTSFKMPAPQIHSKYSPAFKRKSLAVYGSSSTSSNANNVMKTPPIVTTTSTPDPPKSLESICSPTRSDYSFEFASTTSSPEGLRSRGKNVQRKTRMDYDDSDNDSAVSSSQSSISRGFSPPMSPVPSERSTLSSERSYISTEPYQRQSVIMDGPPRTYNRESGVEFTGRSNILNDRTFVSERSSSSSSGSDLRSPSTESSSRNSQIPQLKRSNSTDTNCSTSSTLTSGSQASAESLSRRVLKPQSVEAINRKNILASARCRSGRDLNGSPLIQRKFNEEDVRSNVPENGDNGYQKNRSKDVVSSSQNVKIAYIEVTDSFVADDSSQKTIETSKLSPPRIVGSSSIRTAKFEAVEPSNDLKMWVRNEAKALTRIDKVSNKMEKPFQDNNNSINNTLKSSRSMIIDKRQNSSVDLSSKIRNSMNETENSQVETYKQKSSPIIASKKSSDDQNDLLTILTTKSRSRSAIHVDDGTFGRSRSQMSLEDILDAKGDTKLSRTHGTEKCNVATTIQRPLWESRENRYVRRSSSSLNESWNDDKQTFKIPSLGKSRMADSSGDEMTEAEKSSSKSSLSRILPPRSLGRRSASVTDMKKALEINCPISSQQINIPSHNRFPSLDSSVDENIYPGGTDVDTDRYSSEQFGSISSLASSTSLISQQELAQLVEEASFEEARGAHDVIVVLLHKENPTGSVGITLAGGADCEVKEISVHRVLSHSIADRDGRVQRGDRILSINGRSTQGLTHRESIAVLKQPRSEVVLVVSRARTEDGCKLRSRTASVETIIEGFETNDTAEDTAWGPPSVVAVYKDGAGLGFSLEGGRDSPLGDRPLVIKKIFTGGAAEKTGALKAGDQLLEVNGYDVTRMSRIEAWSLMKKLHDGEVNLLVRHTATKSS